ncbi:MAG: undecaprenyl/decaprenyl-phosphate alpha-N-acetylglucosaminyl 1-phosphate transferase [Bacteroidales bacterium]|nr:undecaprenyl/decaprenyl-phosphate alpha-N-acetylglucosaminyl 1-phosphate transferase [Bacteroidales bacterium]MDE7128204.1 undecaprenyl/decaprenyl-phosphate alpha-N-acetylglucosaminyl 1-phosphate transferase [Bacteroidales bacterium]
MMTYLFLLSGFILACALSMIVLPNILFVSHKKQLFDMPDARKVHHTPVPRLGGLSFAPIIMVSIFSVLGALLCLGYLPDDCLAYLPEYLFLFSGLIILYLTGEADDLVGVSYRYKFLVQILAAILIILSGNWIHSFSGLFGIWDVPGWIGIPATVFVIIFITNSINLIDGIDGLASGLTIISLVTLCALLFHDSSFVHTLLGVATIGVVVPFWFYNVFGNAHRGHKLFMGDTGSLTLGYILSFLVIYLSYDVETPGESRPMIIAFSSLLVPMLDVIRVAFHRIRKGRNPFLPDRNHIHHKLLRAGMRKTRYVMLTIICIDVLLIVLNTLLATKINVTFIILIDVVLWTSIQLVINYYIRKNHGGPSYVPEGTEKRSAE